MTLLEKVKHIPQAVDTLTAWLGENATPVDKTLAQKRCNICLQCRPYHVKEGYFTGKAMESVKRMIEFKNGLELRVKGEKSLGACDICTCSLRTKIWVPIHIVRASMMDGEMEKFPEWCWQKNEPNE